MTNSTNLHRLIEREKLLYLEVEQLRHSLYLHDSSLVFEFFSAFYFAWQDIKRIFQRKNTRVFSPLKRKEMSISSLGRKKKWLHILSKTPYAYCIYFFRAIKLSLSSRPTPNSRGTERSRRKKSFIIFGTTTSADFQSRSVQIARALAEHTKVVYIEGVFDVGSRPGARLIETSKNFSVFRLTAQQSFHLNYQNPSPKEIVFLKKSLRLSTLDPSAGSGQAFRLSTLYIHHPFWSLIFPLKKNGFYFDHAADFTHTKAAAKHIVSAEKKCLKNAKVVTAPHKSSLRNNKSSSRSRAVPVRSLARRRGVGDPVDSHNSKNQDIVLKNGVEWNHFKASSKMIQTCDVGLCWIKKPVMGFIGTLDEKIDEALLGKLATAFPTASIVLVGNTDYRPVIEVAEQYQNIFPVGIQPYKKLPLFLQSFDILITPYMYNKSAFMEHPELPLYLASGKPIVCTALATCEVSKSPLYTPKTHTDWVIAVAEALKEKRGSKKRSLRIAAAKKLTWSIKALYKLSTMDSKL